MRVILIIATLSLIGLLYADNYPKHNRVYATKVVIDKSERKLYLYNGNRVIADFHIALGGNPVGPKRIQGDKKTPEGNYTLDYKKSDSSYYKAIHISYPSKKDKDFAKRLGKSPGGLIMIHGQPNGWGWISPILQRFNWTSGCIAVSNDDMDSIWSMIKVGTPIEIKE